MNVCTAAPVCALAFALAGCGPGDGGGNPASTGARPPVATVVAVEAVSPLLQPATGVLRPPTIAVLASKTIATLAEADFTLGRSVASGEILGRLEAAEVLARRERAHAQLDQIRRERARESGLLKAGASTEDTLRTLDDQLRAATAAAAEAEALADQLLLRAPFAGVISRRHANRGDSVMPGAPLVEIESLEPLRAEIDLPESLPDLPIGTRVPIEIDGRRLQATLVELAPASDPASRTRIAKMAPDAGALADLGVRSGRFVRALWPAGETNVINLPSSAVSRFGQIERLFTVADGIARLRLVRTATAEGGRVRILSGLDAGEIVILVPPPALRDGQAVEVAR